MRDEEIKVRGRDEPFRFTVRSTRHGPLLSDVDQRAEHASAPTRPRATRHPTRQRLRGLDRVDGAEPGNTADALFEIDEATSWQEFRDAARDFAVPSQNLVYADRAGNIGYQAPGAHPDPRSGDARRLPSPGVAAGRRLDGQVRPVRGAAERPEPVRRLLRDRQPGRDRAGLPLLPR